MYSAASSRSVGSSRLRRSAGGRTGAGYSATPRQRALELGQGTRHMVSGSDHDQPPDAVPLHPFLCLQRIAVGGAGMPAEFDAAGDLLRVHPGQMRQLGEAGAMRDPPRPAAAAPGFPSTDAARWRRDRPRR